MQHQHRLCPLSTSVRCRAATAVQVATAAMADAEQQQQAAEQQPEQQPEWYKEPCMLGIGAWRLGGAHLACLQRQLAPLGPPAATKLSQRSAPILLQTRRAADPCWAPVSVAVLRNAAASSLPARPRCTRLPPGGRSTPWHSPLLPPAVVYAVAWAPISRSKELKAM